MAQFRKKPIVIEAQQFTEENKNTVFHWITCSCTPDFDSNNNPIIKIQTLEGVMIASLGDWIIKGTKGEFYPCKPDIFLTIYDPV